MGEHDALGPATWLSRVVARQRIWATTCRRNCLSLPVDNLRAIRREPWVRHSIPFRIIDGIAACPAGRGAVDLLAVVIAAVAVRVEKPWLEEASNAIVADGRTYSDGQEVGDWRESSHASHELCSTRATSVHDDERTIVGGEVHRIHIARMRGQTSDIACGEVRRKDVDVARFRGVSNVYDFSASTSEAAQLANCDGTVVDFELATLNAHDWRSLGIEKLLSIDEVVSRCKRKA